MPRAIFLRISNCEFLPELASVTERRFPPPWSVEETLPITSSLDNNPALDRRRPMTV